MFLLHPCSFPITALLLSVTGAWGLYIQLLLHWSALRKLRTTADNISPKPHTWRLSISGRRVSFDPAYMPEALWWSGCGGQELVAKWPNLLSSHRQSWEVHWMLLRSPDGSWPWKWPRPLARALLYWLFCLPCLTFPTPSTLASWETSPTKPPALKALPKVLLWGESSKDVEEKHDFPFAGSISCVYLSSGSPNLSLAHGYSSVNSGHSINSTMSPGSQNQLVGENQIFVE